MSNQTTDNDGDDEWQAPDLSSDDAVRVDVSTLEVGNTQLFSFLREGEQLSGIVVNWGGEHHVFVNRCPHALFTLDFDDGEVMTDDGKELICWSHGARFEPFSGRCTAGPCRGRKLERLPFRREDDALIVEITPCPPGWPRTYS